MVLFALVPLIDSNLSGIIDDEMFQTLENAQSNYISYDIAPIEKATEKQIYHVRYVYSENVLYPSNNVRKDQAQIIYRTCYTDIQELINSDSKSTCINKKSLDDETVYYRITKTDSDNFVISLLYSDYSSDLLDSLKGQVINIFYIALSLLAVVVFVWITSLIRPLKAIRSYIDDIRQDKESTLNINRGDEIGVLANELVDMKEEIDRQNQIKEEMIHNISHDLKTPIALIKSYSQSVKDDIYPYGDKDSSMDIILENADRLENKVKSLLYLNRLDYISGEENDDSVVNMKELIEHTVIQLQHINENIRFETYLDDVEFKGDEECWRICIENIIENALRYVNTVIQITLEDGYLKIYNDGEHIENTDTEALFKAYEKGTKGQFGLGLAIVAKTCHMFGFVVEAVNEEVGVSFIISKKA